MVFKCFLRPKYYNFVILSPSSLSLQPFYFYTNLFILDVLLVYVRVERALGKTGMGHSARRNEKGLVHANLASTACYDFRAVFRGRLELYSLVKILWLSFLIFFFIFRIFECLRCSGHFLDISYVVRAYFCKKMAEHRGGFLCVDNQVLDTAKNPGLIACM